MSAFSRTAVSRMRSAGTITPRSSTSKLLHWSTTPTMFLPMSCTSPLTVAITTLPFDRLEPSCSFSRYGTRCATAFFITRADFTTCGRNILPAPNRSPTTFMPSISGPSMTSSGRPSSRRAASVSSRMNSSMPLTSACSRRLRTGHSRQARSSARFCPASPLKRLGDLEQPLGGIAAPGQDHVLDALAQFRIDVLVDGELARVHDSHRHAVADRVVQERRMHGLAHHVVAAERERHVADAAADQRVRARLADQPGGLDEVERVAVVALDAGRDREDVRVENDVFRREPDALGQQPVRALADLDLALDRVGLALLVESHDDHGRAVRPDLARLRQERPLAFLEADRVDDALALQALQSRFEHGPLRRIEHDRDARDVRLGRDQVQEAHHRRFRVEHALVHVDVDDLRAARNLLARDVERAVVVLGLDQAPELRRARDVGALAHVHEQAVRPDVERLESAQAAARLDDGRHARRQARDRVRDVLDVLGRRAAATTHDVDEPAGRVLAHQVGCLARGFVVFAECIRQTRIRIGADVRVGDARELLDVRAQLPGAQRAVQPDDRGSRVPHRIPERLDRLA